MEVTAEAMRREAVGAGTEEIGKGGVFGGAAGAAAAMGRLNPDAEEFVPSWRRRPAGAGAKKNVLSADALEFVSQRRLYRRSGGGVVMTAADEVLPGFVSEEGERRGGGVLTADAPEFFSARRRPLIPFGNGAVAAGTHYSSFLQRRGRRNFWRQGRVRSSRVQSAQKEEFVRRTIYVTDIDHTVTEDMLAELFGRSGSVVDCRICGDPTTGLRFAFIELQDENDACAALQLDGITLGICPLRVSPSRTAIMPVNPSYLPQSEAEKEMCSRTIYCTNIDKSVTQSALKYFCQDYFGQVSRIRLLGDGNHATRIAFIEFAEVAGAINALNSTGIFASGLPIRVCPSKTPIRTTCSLPSDSPGLLAYHDN